MSAVTASNSRATPSDGSSSTLPFQLPVTLVLAPTATPSSSAAAKPLSPELKTILLTVVPILLVLLALAIACEVVYLRRRARVKKARHASFGCATAAAAVTPKATTAGHTRERGSVSSERTFVGGDEHDFKNPDRDASVRIVSPYAGLSTPVHARPFSSYTFESRASAWFEPFESSFDVQEDEELRAREKAAPLADSEDDGAKERWVLQKNAFLVHDEMDIADHAFCE